MDKKPIQRENARLYEKHKKNMSKITHKIDNDAPLLPIETVTFTNKAKHDARRFKAITIENRVLMNRIVRMYRTKGTIDSHNKFAGLKLSKLEKGVKDRERYDRENVEMFLRILRKQPNYITAKYSNEWERKSLNDIRHACKQIIVLKELIPKAENYHEAPSAASTNLVYAKFAVNEKPIGRIVMELNEEMAPKCVQRFLECLSSEKPINVQWIFPGTYLRFKHPHPTLLLNFYEYEAKPSYNNLSNKHSVAATFAPDKSLHFVMTFNATQLPPSNYTTIGHIVQGFPILKHIEDLGHRRPFPCVTIYETGYCYKNNKQ